VTVTKYGEVAGWRADTGGSAVTVRDSNQLNQSQPWNRQLREKSYK